MQTMNPTSPVAQTHCALCAGVAPSACMAELGFASALGLLSKFKAHMAAENMGVNMQRMLADSAYADEQLALGHTSSSERLRQSAMHVFALLHA